MIFGTNGKSQESKEAHLSSPGERYEDKIEVVASYKYLGMEVQRNIGIWKEYKERMMTKAKKSMNAAWGLGLQMGTLSVKSGIRIWEGIVRPITEYGAEIWPSQKDNTWDKAEGLQKEMGRRILRLAKQTSEVVIRGELGWWTLRGRRILLRLKYWWKLVNMTEDRLVRRMYLHSRKINNETKHQNWCSHTEALLKEIGLTNVWESENLGSKGVWETRVRDHIQKAQEKQWLAAAKKSKKLKVYRKVKSSLVREEYLMHKNVNGRTALARIRSGEHCLAINTGRWSGEERSNRVCNCMVLGTDGQLGG